MYKMHHFTKTGSGQTYRENSKKSGVSLGWIAGGAAGWAAQQELGSAGAPGWRLGKVRGILR